MKKELISIYAKSKTVDSPTMNAFDRVQKLEQCIKKDISDDQYNEIYPTRGIFQLSTSAYDSTTMQEKVDTLKQLLNKEDNCTFSLAITMMDLVQENGNDIEPLDLAIGMGKIIDFFLKENQEKECCE